MCTIIKIMKNKDHEISNDSYSPYVTNVELCKNSKGTTWKIQVCHPDPQQALDVASDLFKQCKARFTKIKKKTMDAMDY